MKLSQGKCCLSSTYMWLVRMTSASFAHIRTHTRSYIIQRLVLHCQTLDCTHSHTVPWLWSRAGIRGSGKWIYDIVVIQNSTNESSPFISDSSDSTRKVVDKFLWNIFSMTHSHTRLGISIRTKQFVVIVIVWQSSTPLSHSFHLISLEQFRVFLVISIKFHGKRYDSTQQ